MMDLYNVNILLNILLHSIPPFLSPSLPPSLLSLSPSLPLLPISPSLLPLSLSPLRLCTVDGVALVGGFQCPANISDNSTSVCSPENTDLQGIFLEVSIGINQTVYDPTREPPWEDGFEPTCQIGIPGITRTRTIVGELLMNHYDNYEYCIAGLFREAKNLFASRGNLNFCSF